MQRPIVATRTSQAKRRWAQAKEEQRVGSFVTVFPLFQWFFGVWWVGAIHFRGGRSIHVHWFHLWHINTHLVNLLKIRMTFRGSSRCRRQSNAPTFVILCHCFMGDDGVIPKHTVQLMCVSNRCGSWIVHAWRILIETVRLGKKKCYAFFFKS